MTAATPCRRGTGLVQRLQARAQHLGSPQCVAMLHTVRAASASSLRGLDASTTLSASASGASCMWMFSSRQTACRTSRSWPQLSSSLLTPVSRIAAASYSTSASTGAAAVAYVPVPHRGVLSLRGRDTFKLLQGLVSNNVHALERGQQQQAEAQQIPPALYAGLMTPQGRLIADLFLYLVPSSTEPEAEVLLEHDSRITAQVLSFVKRFKLRSKVKLEDASAQWRIGQLLPAEAGGAAAQAAAAIAESAASAADDVLVRADARAPGMGFRVLERIGASADAGALSSLQEAAASGSENAAHDAYTAHRIIHGVAEGSEDMPPEHCLPLEVNLDYMGGVDFRKGCYVGQELTARTHHTGVVRKRMLPVSLYDQSGPAPSALSVDSSFTRALPPAGSEVRSTPAASAGPTGADASATPSARPARGRAAGKLYSGVHNVALACLRLEQVSRVAPPSPASSSASSADALRMSVQTPEGETLGVQPWLPAWWPQEPAQEAAAAQADE